MELMKSVFLGFLACIVVNTSTASDLNELTTACGIQHSVKVTNSDSSVVLDQSNCDTLYPKGKFSAQPVVEYAEADQGKTYTLVMIDPDAPNHPQGNYYLHWIVTNIPGSDLAAGKVNSGTVVASYRGPAPPKNTGDHRYMFLVFEQGSSPLTLSEPKRPQFNLASWVQSVGDLKGPLAGVQFKAHF